MEELAGNSSLTKLNTPVLLYIALESWCLPVLLGAPSPPLPPPSPYPPYPIEGTKYLHEIG